MVNLTGRHLTAKRPLMISMMSSTSRVTRSAFDAVQREDACNRASEATIQEITDALATLWKTGRVLPVSHHRANLWGMPRQANSPLMDRYLIMVDSSHVDI